MKKSVLPLFSLLLVVTMLLSITGTASAIPLTPPSLPEPVVTPVSGDMQFTAEVVQIVSLPGVIQLDSQMLAPVGFPAGEAQFGGNGIVVTDMDSGKATACFSIATVKIAQGWGGKVALWNGTKWVKLATTITPLDESPISLACATITGNGTYAFLAGIADPSLLPAVNTCSVDTSIWGLDTWGNSDGPYFFVSMDNLPDGTPATLTFISANPSSNYSGFMGTTSATVGNFLSTDADFFDSNFHTQGAVLVTVQVTSSDCSATLQINLGAT